MLDSRRTFLSTLASAGILTALQQQPPTPIRQRAEPLPAHPEPAEKLPAGPQGKSNKSNPAALVAREKELLDATDQLLIKVQEFRAKLDGAHTADVFSVNMYKQTEDIEKLAKQLKNRARP
ncbi:MAG: hypothetical protein JSS69_04145 [Acidobacteria bacterium]|nr:hypothetical protein [Acidobacteriota bacterium]MBS1865087.1 hypothetical protein [Acidobacteriota bacterium]